MNPDLIRAQRCENCGQIRAECRRRVPFHDTNVFKLYGPCTSRIQIQSTKQICDKYIWQMLNQTSFDHPGDTKDCAQSCGCVKRVNTLVK